MIEQDNPIGKQTHLYKITGIIDDPHVVNPQRKSVLNYTLFLLAKYHGNGALKADDFLKVAISQKFTCSLLSFYTLLTGLCTQIA